MQYPEQKKILINHSIISQSCRISLQMLPMSRMSQNIMFYTLPFMISSEVHPLLIWSFQ